MSALVSDTSQWADETIPQWKGNAREAHNAIQWAELHLEKALSDLCAARAVSRQGTLERADIESAIRQLREVERGIFHTRRSLPVVRYENWETPLKPV